MMNGHNILKKRDLATLSLALISAIVIVVPAIFVVSSSMSASSTEPSRVDDSRRATILGNLTADAKLSPSISTEGKVVYLDGRNSTDDVFITNYTWEVFTDATHVKIKTLYGNITSYQFMDPGRFNITLTCRDADNVTSTDFIILTVNPDRLPPFMNAGADRKVAPGESRTLNFSGIGCNDNGAIVNYTWFFLLQDQKTVVWLYGRDVSYTFTETGTYEIFLNITDGGGNHPKANGSLIVVIEKKPSYVSVHWQFFFIWLPIILIAAYLVVSRLRRGTGFITKTDVEKARLQWKNFKKSWKIFKANRLGFAGFIVLLIFVVIAFIAPYISTVNDPQIDVEPNLIGEVNNTADDWFNPLPPSLSPSPYTGLRHPFGTDSVGRDIYTLTLYGTRASLEVGLIATFISVVLGAFIGLASGYFGRVTDEALMRLTDFFLVLPWFPLMIVMMAILGQKFLWVVVVIGITSWPSTARVVRSQVLTVKERQFIVRAKAIGAGDGHIIKTHILPNVLPLIFANTVLLIAIAIFSESFLDFFGLGDPAVISWGSMLEGAYNQSAFGTGKWWWIVAPGAAIVIMVLAFSLVGYAIDDVLNPKLRKR